MIVTHSNKKNNFNSNNNKPVATVIASEPIEF